MAQIIKTQFTTEDNMVVNVVSLVDVLLVVFVIVVVIVVVVVIDLNLNGIG